VFKMPTKRSLKAWHGVIFACWIMIFHDKSCYCCIFETKKSIKKHVLCGFFCFNVMRECKKSQYCEYMCFWIGVS
jgi:hypothetical protein